jgi:aryl-alcohol dehydrogenase-like predicted oxidoreductase
MIKAGHVRNIGFRICKSNTQLFRARLKTISFQPAVNWGIGVTAYGVLSRGLISGHGSKTREKDGDFRSINPRFQGDNLDRNLQLVEKLRQIAEAKDVTVAQIAIAWVLAQGRTSCVLSGLANGSGCPKSSGYSRSA